MTVSFVWTSVTGVTPTDHNTQGDLSWQNLGDSQFQFLGVFEIISFQLQFLPRRKSSKLFHSSYSSFQRENVHRKYPPQGFLNNFLQLQLHKSTVSSSECNDVDRNAFPEERG